MAYRIDYTVEAIEDMVALQRSEPKAYAKVQRLIEELKAHPRTGTGHPEQLKGDRAGQWSRRITPKHRLVYTITDNEVLVLVLAAYGHYGDR